jgi:hypothetical protein
MSCLPVLEFTKEPKFGLFCHIQLFHILPNIFGSGYGKGKGGKEKKEMAGGRQGKAEEEREEA